MSNIRVTIDNAAIDEVLSEIRALSNNARLQPGSDDFPIDLNTKITDFISILFGEDGLKNSGDDKIQWLKKQSYVDKSKIDLNRLNDFLSQYRNAIESVITDVSPVAASSDATPVIAPAPDSAVVAATVLSGKKKAKTELKEHLLNIGFNIKEVDDYISTTVSTDLTNAINEILNKTDYQKQESNIEIMSDIFGYNNRDLIKESLKEANGDIVVAGDSLARKLVPQLVRKPVTKPILQQPSIFDGTFFQHKETGLGCGRFALNNLLGGRYFTAVSQKDFQITPPYDLVSIKGLIEKLNPNTVPEPSHMLDLQRLCKYLKINDDTMDDCLSYELYDQSVITNALGLLGYTVVITGGIGVSQIAKPTIDMLDYNTGMIVNLSAAHYIAIRKYEGVYYLMDSENTKANKGSKEFISKLLNYDGNITFVVGPYDIKTSKKTVIRMKIQEYYNKIGQEDEEVEDIKEDIKEPLNDFITNSNDDEGIDLLYKEEIQHMPYELILEFIHEHSMLELARLLTTPEK